MPRSRVVLVPLVVKFGQFAVTVSLERRGRVQPVPWEHWHRRRGCKEAVLPLDGPSELALACVEALAVAPALPEPDGARRGGNYNPLLAAGPGIGGVPLELLDH